jgi:hypothetical protein
MARGTKSGIVLDWFTVTYRSVFLGIAALAAVAVAAYFFWPAGGRADADAAIASADAKYAVAARLPGGEAIDEIRASSRSALDEAHSARTASRWEDAVIAANQSENLSAQAIRMARGDQGGGQSVKLYKIEGDVRVKRAGQFAWEPASRGMVVRVGDQVKTSSSSTVQLLYFDGTVTTVQKGSLLEIRQLSEDPATKVRKVAEKLTWGEIVASTRSGTSRAPSTRCPPRRWPLGPTREGSSGSASTRSKAPPPSTCSRDGSWWRGRTAGRAWTPGSACARGRTAPSRGRSCSLGFPA